MKIDHRSMSNVSSSKFSLSDKVTSFRSWFKALSKYEDYDSSDTSSNHGLSGLLSQQPTTLPYGTNIRPTTPRFSPIKRDNGKPQLPLTSGFFQFSCEYFQEPQLGLKEIDEPGSEEYIKRLWRRNRNEAIIACTQPQKEMALTGDWRNIVCRLNNKTQPKLLSFTQFEKWIVTCDERDNITAFDWANQMELMKFSNGNPFGTKITDLKFINEDRSFYSNLFLLFHIFSYIEFC